MNTLLAILSVLRDNFLIVLGTILVIAVTIGLWWYVIDWLWGP